MFVEYKECELHNCYLCHTQKTFVFHGLLCGEVTDVDDDDDDDWITYH